MTGQQKRVAGMAGLIGVLLVWLLLDMSGPQKPRAAGSARGGAAGEVVAANGSAVAPGSPAELLDRHDVAGLTSRYQPVLTGRPFAVRDFRPKRPVAGPRPPNNSGPRETRNVRPPTPDDLELQLTGTIGTGPGRTAYLEHRSSGKALVVKAGDRVGGSTVAEIETTALILSDGSKQRRLELGDLFAVPPSQERSLTPLRTGPPPSAAASPAAPGAAGQPAAPAISDDSRAEILRKMRERRQAQMQPKKADPSPEQPKEGEAGEGGAAPPGDPAAPPGDGSAPTGDDQPVSGGPPGPPEQPQGDQ